MCDEEICAACLDIDVKMIRITKQIRNVYLEITGLQAAESISIPSYICYLCLAQFQKFYKFKRKCLVAHKLVNLIMSSNGKITKTAMKAVDRKVYGLESHLSYIDVLKSSAMSVQTFEDDRMNDDTLPVTTIKIEYKEEDQCLFEPAISIPAVKNENSDIDEEPSKPSIFEYNLEDMSFGTNDQDEKVPVDIEMPVDNIDCVADENDDENLEPNCSDNEKSIKAYEHLKTEQVKKHRTARKAKKKAFFSKISKLCHMQCMNPEDQKLQLLSRQSSAAYTTKKYKCELCYTGFNKEAAYNRHNKKHEYGAFGKLLCDLCKTYKKSRNSMSSHINSNHFYKYNCKTCGHITYSKMAALLHHQTKHETISYKCPFCDKELRTIYALCSHKNRFHATVPCDLCGDCFLNKQGMIYHKKYKHDLTFNDEDAKDAPTLEVRQDDPLYCKVCQTLFADQSAYCMHLLKSSKHSTHEALKCSTERQPQMPAEVPQMLASKISKAVHCRVCELVLPSYKHALKHYKTQHPESKPLRDYVCDICGKAFMYPSLLENHAKTHTKSVNYDCQECSKTFSSTVNRNRHIKRVHSEKNLLCNECDFKTGSKYELRIHKQVIHENIPYLPRIKSRQKTIEKRRREACEQNYACSKCPKTFHFNASLLQHIKRVHSEKNLLCSHCAYKTASEYELRIHTQVVHMKIPYMPRQIADQKKAEKRKKQREKEKKEKAVKSDCPECPKTFNSKTNLSRHIAMVHKPTERKRSEKRRKKEINNKATNVVEPN